MLTQQLQQFSTRLQTQGLMRRRHLTTAGLALNFSCNDYLSLTNDARVKEAYQVGFRKYPTGSGGSMLVGGYHAVHHALETAFAQALEVEDCLLFSSGYAANLSVAWLLAQLRTDIWIDKSIHASIYDGLRMASVAYRRFPHNHLDCLQKKLKTSSPEPIIVTEGIFSMSGQLAPLSHMALLIRPLNGVLLVDEAHSFGVMGRSGLGSVIEHQLTQAQVPLRIIPFGKALASCGAVVAGSREWIEALTQVARSYTYSTALSPAFAWGVLQTLDLVQRADHTREKLQALITYFRKKIAQSELTWRDSTSPIQQLQLGCPHQALQCAARLRERGILCSPIRQPTLSKRETGLRVILNAHHEPQQIDYLFESLQR